MTSTQPSESEGIAAAFHYAAMEISRCERKLSRMDRAWIAENIVKLNKILERENGYQK